jgi:hypothetical protein
LRAARNLADGKPDPDGNAIAFAEPPDSAALAKLAS